MSPEWTKGWLKQSWEYLTYFVMVLTLLCLIVLVLWLRSKRIRLKLTRLVQTMGNLKIEKTDTVQTADLEDVENVDEGAASTPIQPREDLREAAETTRSHQTAPLTFELARESS